MDWLLVEVGSVPKGENQTGAEEGREREREWQRMGASCAHSIEVNHTFCTQAFNPIDMRSYPLLPAPQSHTHTHTQSTWCSVTGGRSRAATDVVASPHPFAFGIHLFNWFLARICRVPIRSIVDDDDDDNNNVDIDQYCMNELIDWLPFPNLFSLSLSRFFYSAYFLCSFWMRWMECGMSIHTHAHAHTHNTGANSLSERFVFCFGRSGTKKLFPLFGQSSNEWRTMSWHSTYGKDRTWKWKQDK